MLSPDNANSTHALFLIATQLQGGRLTGRPGRPLCRMQTVAHTHRGKHFAPFQLWQGHRCCCASIDILSAGRHSPDPLHPYGQCFAYDFVAVLLVHQHLPQHFLSYLQPAVQRRMFARHGSPCFICHSFRWRKAQPGPFRSLSGLFTAAACDVTITEFIVLTGLAIGTAPFD